MNVVPASNTFNKTECFLRELCCPYDSGHLPQPDMRVGNNHPAFCPQRDKGIPRNHSMRIGNARRVEAVLAIHQKMAVGLQVQIAVCRLKIGGQRAFSATGQPAQNDQIERQQRRQ